MVERLTAELLPQADKTRVLEQAQLEQRATIERLSAALQESERLRCEREEVQEVQEAGFGRRAEKFEGEGGVQDKKPKCKKEADSERGWGCNSSRGREKKRYRERAMWQAHMSCDLAWP